MRRQQFVVVQLGEVCQEQLESPSEVPCGQINRQEGPDDFPEVLMLYPLELVLVVFAGPVVEDGVAIAGEPERQSLLLREPRKCRK